MFSAAIFLIPSMSNAPSNEHSALPAETPRKLPILGIFVAWTLWGVWSAQQSILAAMLSGREIPARTNPLSITIISATFWALLTPMIMTLSRRIRERMHTPTSRIGTHVFVFLCMHTADVTVYWSTTAWLTTIDRPFVPTYFSLVTFNALAYTIVAVLISALDTQDALRARATRESELETQLAMAQFHALRAQLHPHFLFNALNAVSSLIHSDPQRADRMLSRISDLLRTAIATASQPEIPLMDEIEFNRRYLDVERMRYGDRLDVRIDMAGETFDALVPNMLLQPLVENAVKYGIAPHSGKGRVEVTSARRGQQLCIVVRDTGSGFDVEAEGFSGNTAALGEGSDRDTHNGIKRGVMRGVGISTTRARLRKLYGDEQELMLVNVEGGFEVRVTVPFHVRDKAVA